LLHLPLLLFAVALISVDLGILGLSPAAIAARTGRVRHGGGNMPLGQTPTKSHGMMCCLTENGTKIDSRIIKKSK
jgi:hypothetical protein